LEVEVITLIFVALAILGNTEDYAFQEVIPDFNGEWKVQRV